jgi:4-aminobutyrate aminotransferase-like enzyme
MDNRHYDNPEWSAEVLMPKIATELDALKREYPNQICMLVTEPYLGAKGSFHPPKWYLRQLNDWCNKNDVVFILDEVQSCHGRTGNMYAFQTYGLDPDLVVLGKGLGNGEPVATIVGRTEILESLDYGEASDTYSGNPRACAAILAVLDTFEKFPIVENCRQMQEMIEAGLYQLIENFEFATYVRGEGLVWGLEVDSYSGKTADEIANECVLQCYLQGLHLMGPLAGNVLRVSPPLVISQAEVEAGLELMYQAFEQVANTN